MMNSKELAQKIAAVLDTKQGEDIMMLEVSHLTSIADYFVIVSGQNTMKVRAMAETVEDELEKDGEIARRKEGYQAARWIVLDYASVIVHVFHTEERAFYNIERLWTDGGNLTPFLPDTLLAGEDTPREEGFAAFEEDAPSEEEDAFDDDDALFEEEEAPVEEEK